MPSLRDHALLPYQVDDLILLVGSNPLPNAVAGALLVRPGGTIHLVHSADTEEIAAKLRDWFGKCGTRSEKRQIHESDAGNIYQQVAAAANESSRAGRRVGLNYTGGTKAMAVHAHRAVTDAASGRGSAAPVLSYLDARRLELHVDPIDGAAGGVSAAAIPVATAVSLTIPDLTRLHGWELKRPPSQDPQWPMAARILAEAHQIPDGARAWRSWCETVLKDGCCRRDAQGRMNWKAPSALPSQQVAYPTASPLSEVAVVLRAEAAPGSETFVVGELADRAGFGSSPKAAEHLCKWLDGIWLESFVLDTVRCLAPTQSLTDFGGDLKTTGVEFQFDVAAVRGYQLFGLSCSTSLSKAELKGKLFEAYFRTRQLGGDDARVGLVCSYANPEQLQHEMRELMDVGQIRVFGAPHLKRLDTELAAWIERSAARE